MNNNQLIINSIAKRSSDYMNKSFINKYKECIINNHKNLELINSLQKNIINTEKIQTYLKDSQNNDFLDKIKQYNLNVLLTVFNNYAEIKKNGISIKKENDTTEFQQKYFPYDKVPYYGKKMRKKFDGIFESHQNVKNKVFLTNEIINLRQEIISKQKANAIINEIKKNQKNYLKNLTPILKEAQSNINDLRTLITGQSLFYNIVQDGKILDIPKEDFENAILEDIYDSRGGNTIDYNANFKNARILTEFLGNLGKQKNESLEMEVYNKVLETDKGEIVLSEYKKDTFTYINSEGEKNTLSLGSLQYYRGGDTARFNSQTGLYEILQQKFTGGMISFDTTIEAMKLIDSSLNKKLSKADLENALINIFTYKRNGKNTIITIMDAANEAAIETIRKNVKDIF